MTRLLIDRLTRGRVLCVEPDGTLYLGRGLAIWRSGDGGRSWTPLTRLPQPLPRRLAGRSRLASRLLRNEVRACLPLCGGRLVAASRERVFWADPGQRRMTRSRIRGRGPAPRPPMQIACGPGERLLWGEYWGNKQRREVRLYASDDGGRSFHLARSFAPGEIRHVHGIFYDAGLDHYWVLAGDHRDEPGIGQLSADLRRFQWLVKGQQIFRACVVLDLGSRLVYGTDTEMEPNAVISVDKASGRAERLCEVNGSCIYACRFGGLLAISTTVEPSRVNRSRMAALWVSRDGDRWDNVFELPKDGLSATYFQFGSLVLPRGHSDHQRITVSGQALEELDGLTLSGRLAG